MLVADDITNRREAEQKLKNSLQLNTNILNSISDIFISIDIKWNINFINPPGETFAGKKSADIIGKNLWEVLFNYMESDFHTNLVSAMKTKTFTDFEYYDEKGKEWYHFRLYPGNQTLTIYGSRITEQKTAQQLLEESKKRYELFITQATEGIWRFEMKKPVSTEQTVEEQMQALFKHAFVAECNNSMARMCGLKEAKELEGKSFREVVQQNEKNDFSVRSFIKAGYRLKDVETIHQQDGRTFYFLNNLVGQVTDKKLVSIWGTRQDITSRKLVEETLNKTRERLNFALAAGSVGTYVWNFETNSIHWTKVQESLYGLKEYSFKGTLDDWFSFIHPDDVAPTRKAIEESIEKQQELSAEFRIYWPDGSLHWILSRASTSYDKNGKPVEMTGVNIDISERKFREQVIHENEERFEALVQNSFDVITVFNYDGTITYQSDSIQRVLDYPAKERIGRNLFENSLVHPEDREEMKGNYLKDALKILTGIYKANCA